VVPAREGYRGGDGGGAARKRHFLSHLYIKCIILPRQARDKHRENSKKVPFSLRMRLEELRCVLLDRGLGVSTLEGGNSEATNYSLPSRPAGPGPNC
jgi:hypothetical protein